MEDTKFSTLNISRQNLRGVGMNSGIAKAFNKLIKQSYMGTAIYLSANQGFCPEYIIPIIVWR